MRSFLEKLRNSGCWVRLRWSVLIRVPFLSFDWNQVPSSAAITSAAV